MARFAYVAKNKEGHTVNGTVEALGKTQALQILRGKEFLVLKLEEERGGAFRFSFKFTRSARVSVDELAGFARQMATLIESGIPVVTAIDILSEQYPNEGFKKTLSDVKTSINTGLSLSEALKKHSAVFPALLVSMIRSGETSGMLDVVLDRVATYMEKSNALQKKVKSALIYPAVVIFMAIAITLVMILKVIPVFKDIFSGFGAQLPGPTQFLINMSDFMTKNFIVFIGILAGMITVVKWYLSTSAGKLFMDTVKLKMPLVGPLFRKVAISRFTRTLSTLLKSGVPILSALEIVGETSGNLVIENSVSKVRLSVRDGENIAPPMERSGIFPPMVTRMIAVGEKSGELEKMLSKIADSYDEQVDTTVDGLTSLLEPLIIAFLGIVIGGIVFCMFLPIFKISQVVNM
ncbi:MAG: type II secretion system F family protein [Candidatus Omnitrophota bacterium]